jgi:hypothetical protein
LNTLVIEDEEVAVLGTIVEYSCLSENFFEDKHVLIGPRTAVCTSSGKWSANLPICRGIEIKFQKYVEKIFSSSLINNSLVTILHIFIK